MNITSVMNPAANQAHSPQQSHPAEPPKPEAKAVPVDNDETFISKAYRSLVLNRMGVNSEQLEEIEQKIEELENQSSLTKDEKDKLQSLINARDQLFAEAMQREMEEGSQNQPKGRAQGFLDVLRQV